MRAAKLKGGLDVDRDRHRLTLVQDLLAEAGGGSRPGLMLDANECWSRKQAVRYVAELERTLDLIWVEEPVRRWDAEGHAAVGRGMRASVASGENLSGLEQFRPLLAAGALDIVQTASVWGVTHFLRVAALAHAYDLPVSPIGTNPVGLLHAATSLPNHLVSELQVLHPPVGIDIDLRIEDGSFVLGDTPGLGISMDEAAIAVCALQPATVSFDGPGVRPERAAGGCSPSPAERGGPRSGARAWSGRVRWREGAAPARPTAVPARRRRARWHCGLPSRSHHATVPGARR
ncbi:enolase C-terminal domain-like protein [Catellatospora coxensis]